MRQNTFLYQSLSYRIAAGIAVFVVTTFSGLLADTTLHAASPSGESGELDGRSVAILVENMYEDLELWYPYYRLKEAGAEVMIVGPKEDTSYESKHGYPATSDRAAADVSADKLDGVIIPGGYSPDRMRRHPEMVQLVHDLDAAGKLVAAICHGGWMLCSADVLEGREATSYSSIKDDMVHAGADWVDRTVVRDKNLVTSRFPADLPNFMRTVIAVLHQQASAK